jgi:hypothetical protein
VQDVIAGMRERGMLDEPAVSRARALVAEGKSLEDAVIAADGLGEEAVLRFLADAFELPFVDAETLEKSPPTKEFLAAFPIRVLLRHRLLPLMERDGQTVVATCRITDHSALDELRLASGRDVAPVLAPAREIERFL